MQKIVHGEGLPSIQDGLVTRTIYLNESSPPLERVVREVVEVIKEVPVETIVYVDKPVEVIREITVPVEVEVVKIVYVDKPIEIVKEVITYVDKPVEVEVIKEIIKEIKVEVVKEVPVEIQRLVFKKDPKQLMVILGLLAICAAEFIGLILTSLK